MSSIEIPYVRNKVFNKSSMNKNVIQKENNKNNLIVSVRQTVIESLNVAFQYMSSSELDL
jgi:hypothetical protein